VPFGISGCGSSSNEPQAQLPPEIQAKHDKADYEWHSGLNEETKGKGFVESMDIQKEYTKKHGPMPH
jgi:hypothetical protein